MVDREESKRRYRAYRERARELYTRGAVVHEPYYLVESVSIPEHATVHMTEDGAFVEAIVWVPFEQIKEK